MASKQLGKLRQWAGEVISSKDKTTVSDDFKELEKDIELRRDGATRLLAASEAWKRTLSKKKKNDALDEAEKLLPIDALGIVMIVHGEEFGDDSAFGTSMAKLGRAHCKVATLQEAFALSFNDTFIVSVEKFLEVFKEYDANRKKLDSRRLSYDAAITKFEKVKGSKKEKERKEAEDEMERCKERYEEASDEVQAQMHAIQENEIDLLRDLTLALDLEINYVEQYLSVLQEVRGEWYNESSASYTRASRPNGAAHNFSRSQSSVHSIHSINSYHSAVDASDDGHATHSVSSRRPSIRARTPSNASEPPSRPTSRNSTRKRSESTGTTAEKDEQQEKASRRLSMADWASDAFGSVTGRSKKVKDKDQFANLSDDEGTRDGNDDPSTSPTKKSSGFRLRRRSSSKDKSQSAGASPKPGSKILKPLSLQERKVARAVESFRGSSDELSFEVGDEILVVNETLEDWWTGELNGKRGLFPTSHVEVMMVKPGLSMRSFSRNKGSSQPSPADDPQRRTLTEDSFSILSTDADLDDQDFARPPLSAHHAHGPFYGARAAADVVSISDSMAEDDDDLPPASKAVPNSFEDDFAPSSSFSSTLQSKLSVPPPLPRRTSDTAKKVPPPPPPRRSTTQNLQAPPIPARPTYSSSKSSIKSQSSTSSIGHDRSPFESVSDFDVPATAKGCMNFKQSQFQPQGMCANCSQFHG